jgi:putative heme-binding domain-containing protein
LTAINALRPHLESAAADFIFDRWSTFGPGVRTAALANLMRRAATTAVLLKAMLAGRIPSAVLSVDQRARLLVRTDTKIRALATKLLGSAVSSDRLAVAKKYRPALELKGDAGKGAEIFGLVCATCHRARGKGHSVGPDITDVRNRSAEAILYDILDPNRGVEPQYTAYEIETKDDRSLSGLLLNETPDSVTLQQAGDLRHIISRSDITELRASSLSLMPEGIEQAVSVPQMADLITFLQSE